MLSAAQRSRSILAGKLTFCVSNEAAKMLRLRFAARTPYEHDGRLSLILQISELNMLRQTSRKVSFKAQRLAKIPELVGVKLVRLYNGS